MVKAVLFDLDGVVRHFDPGHVAAIETRHGLAPGLIPQCAFSSPLIEQVTTGRMRRREWVAVGLDTRFDAIFNSAAIGYIKPDVRVFRHVLEALHLQADEVFFTDDSASHLLSAERLGMIAHRFQGVPELRLALGAAGVVLDGPHDGA